MSQFTDSCNIIYFRRGDSSEDVFLLPTLLSGIAVVIITPKSGIVNSVFICKIYFLEFSTRLKEVIA